MWQKIKEYIGLSKRTPYVSKYFEETNIRASIYMSVVVIVLEIWMILRTLIKYVILSDKTRDFNWIVNHFSSYFLLLSMGVLMLVFAVRYLRKKKQGGKMTTAFIILFSAVCIGFGINISMQDYAKGHQIITFLTMSLYVSALLIWRPFISFLVSSITFIAFYLITNNAVEGAFYEGDKINYFTFWISLLMVSVSLYRQRLAEAAKDENLEIANKNLEKMAIEDDATGIKNMNFFTENVAEILMDPDTELDKKIFLFLDITNFKTYNDHFGFKKGTEFLKKFAQKTDETFHDSVVARLSDDHFAVFADRDQARERLREIRDFLLAEQKEIKMELKVGGYIPVNRDVNPRQACDRARYACGLIKKMYGQDYKEYDKQVDDDFHRRQYIVNTIDEAVSEGYIKVYYQPVVWSDEKKLCGCEALARWIDPNYGFLSPAQFIPVLEEHRQIHKLDACIFETVCRDLRAMIDEGRKVVPVSLNFSRLDFELMDAVNVLETLADRYQVPHDLIHVEITESALTNNLEELQRSMEQFRKDGYALWLDDFGSGYSSLNVLKDYSFDVLKIDMKFLSSFGENDKTKTIIESVINMADSLGMRTLTEGVETLDQAGFLQGAGCGRLQGYLYGKPMPLEELKAKIDDGTYMISQKLA